MGRWSRSALLAASSAFLFAGCGRFAFDPATDGTGDGGNGGNGDGSMTGDSTTAACPAFAILCEDFESGSLAQFAEAELIGNGSTFSITTTRAFAGQRALEADKPASASGGAAAAGTLLAPHTTGMLAARAWVYASTDIKNFNLVLSLTDAATGDYVTVGGDSSANWVATEGRAGITGATDYMTSRPTTRDQWVCVEVDFTFGNPPHVDVSIDDTLIVSTNGVTPSPTFDRVRVGVVRGDQIGFHAFTDNVVVAHQHIGCQ